MGQKILNSDGTTKRVDEQVVAVFTTLAQMKATPPVANPDWTTVGTPALLVGATVPFDQAIKLYAWDPDETGAGNDTTIVQPTAITGGNPGRWRTG